MAITLADFNKIWASTSPLTPYSFSEANYKEGWNFVGSTPPSRQMWDFLQKNNDEKMQYLADNYLPLSGGTMTGTIKVSGYLAGNTDNTSNVRIVGGTNASNGATFDLYGKDHITSAGRFSLLANDGTNSKYFIGKPNGELTWDGNDITPQTLVTVNAEDISVSNNTVTNLCDFTLTKGTWLVHMLAFFSSNSSGYRRIGIGTSNSSIGYGRFWYIASPPANGNETRLSLATFITTSSTTTYYANVHQTSGSTLTSGGGVQVIRVSPLV